MKSTFQNLLTGLGLAVCLLTLSAAPNFNLQETAISSATKKNTSFASVVKIASHSVVNVYTSRSVRNPFGSDLQDPMYRFFFGVPGIGPGNSRDYQVRSLGSGIIISPDGYVLTNQHVVESANDVKIASSDGKEYPAKIVGVDAQTDVAVLRIEGNGFPAIAITDSDRLEIGDAVLAIGNPFGLGQTVTVGHVSALERGEIGLLDYENFIQTDASINPGNSGGALIDAEGRLVGLNTAIISRTGGNQGVGFAVPINLARSITEKIIHDGRVIRSNLGVMIQPVTADLARQFKLPDTTGALIAEVTTGSAAEEAGLKEGDVITELQNKKITDSRHFRLMIAQVEPKTKVLLKVIRDGSERKFTVQTKEVAINQSTSPSETHSAEPQDTRTEVFEGAAVAELDLQGRRQFGIPATINGLLVVSIDIGSPAEAVGVRAGDVIQEIDRHPVRSAKDALDLNRSDKSPSLLRIWSEGSSRYLILNRFVPDIH